MLVVIAALKGYAIEATDGRMGTVSDFLFDDTTWKLRWVVVNTGTWLTARKVLVHPAAIGKPDHERHELNVALTKGQVEAGPNIRADRPVSRQAELSLYSYYGWSPIWDGGGYFGGGLGLGAGGLGTAFSAPPFFAASSHPSGETAFLDDDADPHLRSAAEIVGYHAHASDGLIGHVENLLVDDAEWSIRYLIVDTKNWWLGRHVLISPYAVTGIIWDERELRLNVPREKVKSSPKWDPLDRIDQAYEKDLHHHYNWPAYGFW